MTKISADRKGADKIFDKWKSNFRDKQKGKDHIYENFNELFFEMSRNFIPSEVAYEYIRLAATRHLPDNYVVDRTYNNSASRKSQTKAEFFEGWKTMIFDKATQAFYDVYPLDPQQEDTDKIQLPRGMSKKEYVLQRKHAQEFPILDIAAIMESYKSVQDEKSATFEDLLGDLDGKDRPGQD